MKRKYRIIITTYAAAAITGLGIYSFACSRLLQNYELAADYSASRAFEETISSVEFMDSALQKSVYATDSAMCSRLCAEAYAGALAAETAMSSLPFSTQELEQLSAFLNFAGDYAYTLTRQNTLPEAAQLDILSELASRSGDFARKLRQLQGSVNSGELLMDKLHRPLGNVEQEMSGDFLSGSFLEYESSMGKREIPEYDGQYTPTESSVDGDLSEEEMKALAALYAGVDVQQLRSEHSYEGQPGRKCYSAGDTFICVSPAGVESLGQSRLVGKKLISDEQAEKIAADYLTARGYEDMKLSVKNSNGNINILEYAATENGVIWPDNYIKIAIAMDDGSVYSFNALNFSENPSGVCWEIDEKEARKAVPESLSIESVEKQISNSAGGQAHACYSYKCINDMGDMINVLVDGKTGHQMEISIT